MTCCAMSTICSSWAASASSRWEAITTGCDVPEWLEPAEKVGTLYDLFAAEFGVEIAEAICFENACSFFERNETA